MKLAKTEAQFDALVKRMAKNANKAQDEVHEAACSAVSMVADDFTEGRGVNVDRVARVIMNMPTSMRRKALASWFERVLPVSITFKKGSANIDKCKLAKKAGEFEIDIAWACANPFWVVEKPEKDVKPVDLRIMLANVSKAAGAVLKGKKAGVQDPDEAARIQAGIEGLIATLKA